MSFPLEMLGVVFPRRGGDTLRPASAGGTATGGGAWMLLSWVTAGAVGCACKWATREAGVTATIGLRPRATALLPPPTVATRTTAMDGPAVAAREPGAVGAVAVAVLANAAAAAGAVASIALGGGKVGVAAPGAGIRGTILKLGVSRGGLGVMGVGEVAKATPAGITNEPWTRVGCEAADVPEGPAACTNAGSADALLAVMLVLPVLVLTAFTAVLVGPVDTID